MFSIEARIERHAQATPNKVAVVTADDSITYRQLYDQAVARAEHYKNMRGKGVALTASSNIGFIINYFATHIAGAVAVLLPATATPEQVSKMEKALHGFTFPEGSADVLFTTGTTGAPKGAVISTLAIAANAENITHGQAYHPDITFIIPV